MTLRDSPPRPSARDRRTGFRLGGSGLRPLREIEDRYEVADGYPDIRGWIVSGKGRAVVGSVSDLIVDPESLYARYLLISLGPQGTDEETGRRVLVPMTDVVLHPGTDEALIPSLTAAEIAELPAYSRAMLDRDDDAGLLRRIGVRAVVADAERPVEVHASRAEPRPGDRGSAVFGESRSRPEQGSSDDAESGSTMPRE